MKLTKCVKKVVSVLCLSFVACGCASTGDKGSGSLFQNKTANDNSVYFAQSPSMQTPQKELAECLFRVARQISLRQQVTVKCIISTEKAPNGALMKRSSVLLDYDQNNSIAILEKLTVLKIFQTADGTEALIKFGGKTDYKTPFVSIKSQMDTKGNPSWVSKPPAGAKYYAAVGSISQISNTAEAFSNSDSNAIGALAALAGKPVISGNTYVYMLVMKGAYIARRWYNASENRYYSLAVLPR